MNYTYCWASNDAQALLAHSAGSNIKAAVFHARRLSSTRARMRKVRLGWAELRCTLAGERCRLVIVNGTYWALRSERSFQPKRYFGDYQ